MVKESNRILTAQVRKQQRLQIADGRQEEFMKLNIDSPWIQAGIRLTDLLILNFYFILGCLPLITIGCSLIACSSVCMKMCEEREGSSMTREFWSAYKNSLARGILYTLLTAFVLWCLWLNVQVFMNFTGAPILPLMAAVLGSVILYIHLLYAFALEGRYDNSMIATLINSRKIAVRFFLKTLMITGLLVIQFLLFARTSALLSYIGLFCAPVIMIYTVCSTALPVFQKIEKDACATDGFSISSACAE